MAEALVLIMRWIHISSVTTLIGGVIYGRLVMWPAIGSVAPDTRAALEDSAAARFRGLVYAAMTGLVLSGIYNILSNPGHSARYHMLLGIKLLLVAHVFAVALLIVKPANARRARLMVGMIVSGLAAMAISAYLRRIF
jgi:uncharacterized membrane protein